MIDFARQRQRLEVLLAHLTRRSRDIERDLRREQGPLDRDWEEQSLEVENDEVLARLAEQGPGQVAIVRAALDRMASGSYGRCVDCGGSIADARLEALPYAVRCIACEERFEERRE